jgi:hypothetical protein
VDSGYALRPRYLPQHPRKRYHVKEIKNRSAGDAQELFNRHHSKLRNVIEQTFGAAEAKWQMLKGIPHYSKIKQSQIIMSLCGLPTTCTIWRDKSKQGRIGNHKDLAV